MTNETLREKLASLQAICLIAGGILTFILLCTAFYRPDLAAAKLPAVGSWEKYLEADELAHGHEHDEHAHDDHHADDHDSHETKNADTEAHADEDHADGDHAEDHAAAHGEGEHGHDDHAHAGGKEKKNLISRPFQTAYLIGWLFILAPTLGSFALLMIIHLTSGGWGFVIRRILEASMKTIVPVVILFIPLVIPVVLHEHFKGDAESAYMQVTNYDTWLDVDPTDSHSITAKKVDYLDIGFFYLRQVVYVVCWIFFVTLFYRWSRKQDESGDIKWRKKMKFWAGPVLLTHVLLMTFFAFDWGMSMEPEWFSSIYGVIVLIGQGLSTFAFALIMVCFLSKYSPVKNELTPDRLHNIGNMQFAFIILWTYTNLSQFIIIWSANLPEETPFYINRGFGTFQGMTVFLFLFQFLVPFLILLSRHTKRHTATISLIAAWIIFMRVIDLIWLIIPSVYGSEAAAIMGPEHGWAVPVLTTYQMVLAVFAPVALGLLWLGLFFRNLRKLPLLPTKDPVFSSYFDYKEVNS